ncbi:MAG TPA: NmrA family NAD(P)-binding protein [Solirubrobacter sp.]|nr:NmrA family NAD(P)-binding protein [Solirubrobacter sp.]
MTKTIAVHGATGAQGAPVAAHLTAAGYDVRPLSRATGANLFDRSSLEAAYAGVDAVVLQLPLIYDERALVLADNAARAAESAGVEHLVINASTTLPPEPIGVPFLDARHRAAAAAVARVTMLQPTLYLENILGAWSLGRDGVIAYPIPGDVPVPWVAIADVAVAVERAIARRAAGWFALPGAPTTGNDVARALADATGRPIVWRAITPDEFAVRARPHLGDHAADETAAVYRRHAGSPPLVPDAAPARDALDWTPRDVAAWAAEVSLPPLAAAA